MGDKLPQISGERLGRVLLKLGFVLLSQRGSHMKFVRNINLSKEIMIVPNHKILKKGMLGNLLKQLKLSVEGLRELV